MNKIPIVDGKAIIPDGTTYINEFYFAAYPELQEVYIPDSVIELDLGSFCGCVNLTRIVVSKTHPKYDSRCNCNAIIETDTNKLIQGCKTTVIPDSVVEIAPFAFYNSYITEIEIPDSVEKIGSAAFAANSELRRISLSRNITEIECNAFAGCEKLETIDLPPLLTILESGLFSLCRNLRVFINEGITKIDDGALCGCYGIEVAKENDRYDSREGCNCVVETATNTIIEGGRDVYIPDSIQDIRLFALVRCNSILVSDTHPKYDSREGCNAVIETETNTLVHSCCATTIPESVTRLAMMSVYIDEKEFAIPKHIREIDVVPFGYTSISKLVFPDAEVKVNGDLFDTDVCECYLFVPSNRLEYYKATLPESHKRFIVEMP